MENSLQIVDISDYALTPEKVQNQVNIIQKVMQQVMKENEHFGKIPGCGNKPTLLKAGAEKLSSTFHLAPKYDIKTIDLGNGHREEKITCTLTLIGSDTFIGQGVGSCSTMEGKYRFRTGTRTCPECGKENTIIKGKKEYGGGWLCYKNKGGCGAKFKDDDPFIINQDIEKVEHDNPADYYNCVSPDTKILTHNLQWIPAGELTDGDILIGVEENMSNEYARHFALGEAKVYGTKIDQLYEIEFEDGRVVKCNGEHQWLVKKIGLKGTEWVNTQNIYKEITERKGRPRSWSVMSVSTTWEEDMSKEAGYIAGLLDADGSLGSTQMFVMFAQQDNIVLTLINQGLIRRGYKTNMDSIISKETLSQRISQKPVYQIRVLGGFAEQLRLLGSIRPQRLLERWFNLIDISNRRLEGRGSGAGRPVKIVSITPIGEGEVVILGTSCHTYIAEGFVCHNTILKMAKKRAHVDAILTATAASDIFTQDIEDMPEVIPGVKSDTLDAEFKEVTKKQTKKLDIPETIHPDEIPNSGKDDYAQHIQLETKPKLSEAKISVLQAAEINDLILESGLDASTFMRHFEIKTINDLPLIKYDIAINKLKATLKAVKASEC